MNIDTANDPEELGKRAGKKAAALIREAIHKKGGAAIILATGVSQFETLKQLILEKDIAWDKVVMFHLDEYIGLPASHKASFRRYLKERFLDKIPGLKSACLINGQAPPEAECKRLADLINRHSIDVAFVGIGENAHLAFNDPPANFEITDPYILVGLNGPCRQQQVNEDWFETIEEVPKQAISMSVRQILLSRSIICSVPGIRKARAVKDCLEQEVNNLCPASILKEHPDCHLFLDTDAASLLNR